jgi:hypothetical protein
MARWISVGRGEDVKRFPVGEQEKTVVQGLYVIPENSPPSYRKLVDAVASIYNSMDSVIDSELMVKEAISRESESFNGHMEAYEEIMDEIQHVYLRLTQIHAHVRNLNRIATRKGVNLRYLQGLLEPVIKQGEAVLSVLRRIPQASTESGRIAVEKQEEVVLSMSGMADQVRELRGLDYQNATPARTKSDWQKIRKGALNRYLRENGGALSTDAEA